MNYTIKLIFAGIFLLTALIPLSALAKPSPQPSASTQTSFDCARINKKGDIKNFACDADGNPIKTPKPKETFKYTGWILENGISIAIVIALLIDLFMVGAQAMDRYFPEEEARFRAEERRDEDGELGW